MKKYIKRRVRKLVMAWSDKIKLEESDREKKRQADWNQAQGYVIRGLIGNTCIHDKNSPHRYRYCGECPIGTFDNPDLTYGASRIVCPRSRHYSK